MVFFIQIISILMKRKNIYILFEEMINEGIRKKEGKETEIIE